MSEFQDNTPENKTGENENTQRYANPYAGSPQNYPNDSYYGGQQYYAPNADYPNGQYNNYGANTTCQNQQYYGQYNNYGPNNGYNNGPYPPPYGQNNGYNGQYTDGANGQYGSYGQNAGYNNAPYYGPNYGPNPYPNPQYAYLPNEPVKEPVANTFFYILIALTTVSVIASIVASTGLIRNIFSTTDFDSLVGQNYTALYSSMLYSFSHAPGYAAYSTLNSLLGFGILAVSIIDIIQIHKKGYPILGLILFAILFKPGYFIWRAHIVKQKKLIPILFTVGYVLLYIGYFFWCCFYIATMIA